MKTFLLATLVGFAAASPILIERDISITANEYVNGGCSDIIFFYARGTAELGNMGSIGGPQTANGLQAAFGDSSVAVQGIDYPALISTNFCPGGADPNGVKKMANFFIDAATKCPDSIIVAGGYSQGAAMTHRAIENLPQNVKDKIVGVVTYGDTQNEQDHGQINNFPKDKILIICNPGDQVCNGTLLILPQHLLYGARAPEGVAFLTQKIQAAQ